jgi:hypothetical protein
MIGSIYLLYFLYQGNYTRILGFLSGLVTPFIAKYSAEPYERRFGNLDKIIGCTLVCLSFMAFPSQSFKGYFCAGSVAALAGFKFMEALGGWGKYL